MDNRNRCSFLSCSTRTTASVRIVLNIFGQTIVDDVCQVVHIETASRHISRYKQLYAMAAELLHREFALLLGKFSVQGIGIVAVANQVVCHFLRLKSSAAENDGVYARVEVHDAFESEVFIARVYHIKYVVDVLGSFVATADLYLLGIGQVVLCDTFYLLTHRCAEEQSPMLAWDAFEDAVEFLLEAHRKHFVCLVEDNVLNLRKVCHTTIHQVHQAARRSHDDVYTMLKSTDLRLDVRASVNGQNVRLGHVFAEALHIVRNLQTEFACRAKYDDSRPVGRD